MTITEEKIEHAERAGQPLRRPARLADHHRPQEDRHSLHGHRLRLLPGRRVAGDADPGRADGTWAAGGRRGAVQPAVHDARQHHDVPVRGPLRRRAGQLPDPAADRGPRHVLSPPERAELLAVPGRRPDDDGRLPHLPGRRILRLDRLPPALRTDLLAGRRRRPVDRRAGADRHRIDPRLGQLHIDDLLPAGARA